MFSFPWNKGHFEHLTFSTLLLLHLFHTVSTLLLLPSDFHWTGIKIPIRKLTDETILQKHCNGLNIFWWKEQGYTKTNVNTEERFMTCKEKCVEKAEQCRMTSGRASWSGQVEVWKTVIKGNRSYQLCRTRVLYSSTHVVNNSSLYYSPPEKVTHHFHFRYKKTLGIFINFHVKF